MAPRGSPPAVPTLGQSLGQQLRLMAVNCRADGVLARAPGSARTLFVRPPPPSELPAEGLPVEGETFLITIADSWTVGQRQWLTGPISEVRLDAATLGLEPLALVDLGPWDHRRDQHRDPPAGSGSRREFEFERIPPTGSARAGAESTLHRAIDLWATGELPTAEALLGELLGQDLRCIAAHSYLGFVAFNAPPNRGGTARALRHYAAGLAIAELSLSDAFDGVLAWDRPGNRPFLRCLHGRSICLWRQGDLAGARSGLRRLCRLNPGDQLAARVALDSIDRDRR